VAGVCGRLRAEPARRPSPEFHSAELLFVNDHYDGLLRAIGPRVRSGEIRYRENIVDGLEKAPDAFIGMLAGRNFDKALVRIS
jgi:NADPH-dependent curcumin reductase CurA